jgi:serine/threonine-protein kinase
MSQSTLPSPYPLPGEIIGDSWRIEKIMGEGGMGAVARAWDLILHTPVAIKFMNPQYLTFPGAEERFINEGKASALIKSDHVVPVMKAGKTATGTPYLVMECLEGVDLADLIARDGPSGLPVERAVHFVLQVLRALQAAHAIGIIHRDMKPSNCFAVNKDGEDDFVKILDFGISKIQKPGSASLTQTNSALGTPLYMSPEQARSPRDVDARSDLYSVGVILYELLTGHTPFFSESGEFTEILFKLFTADPPPVKSTRPDLPDALAAAVHKALAREVDNRFSSALDMAEALAPFASDRSTHVLSRMRAFRAPIKTSMAPEDLPQSMEAFSRLQHGSQTDAMANRPTTDVMKGPPVTEKLPRSAVGAPAPLLMQSDGAGASEGRLLAVPAAVAARARPDEAGARTQFDSNPGGSVPPPPPPERPFVAGAQTDLSTARDTSVMALRQATATPEEKKRSPMIYALPVIAVIAIVGGVVGLKSSAKDTSSANPPPSATAVAEPSTTPIAKTTPPPPSAIPSTVDTSAQVPVVPSASASASASATVVRTVPRPPPSHVVVPPTHTSTNPLDTDIKR